MRSPSRSIKPTGVPTRVGPGRFIGHTVPSAIFYPRGAGYILRIPWELQALAGGLAGISDADINGIIVGFKAICALMFVVRVDLLSGPSGRTGAVLDVLSLQIAG